MAIPGQANINIANTPNDPVGSDSLFSAFNTIQNNFTQLFTQSSPIVAVSAGAGINVTSPTSTSVQVTNTGVTSLIAGNNITISSATGTAATTGALIINATGGNGGGGGVTSVGVISNSLSVTNSPIIASGNISIELANTGVTAGNYRNPNVTVDSRGRVTSIANGAFTGVTSVGVIAGNGLSVSGSPVNGNSGGNTGAGNITIENTGVLSLTAGTGIVLSGNTGNITISSTGGGGGGSGTVTRVGVVSNTLSVTGSPIVSSGNISIDMPANLTVTGIVASLANISSVNANTLSVIDANGNPVETTLYSNSTSYNTLTSQRARGTSGLPSTVITGDTLLNIRAQGYTSFNTFQNSGSISILANGSPANSSALVPSDIVLNTSTAQNTFQVFRFTTTGETILPGLMTTMVYNNTATTYTHTTTRARGTASSIANIQSGDTLYKLDSYGYTGNGLANIQGRTGMAPAGTIEIVAAGVPGSSGHAIPSTIRLYTYSSGNALQTFSFTNTGNIDFGGVINGNGSGLSSITGANVTGTVSNATYAASAGSATTATSATSATTATTAGTVTTAAQPNITSVGTLTSLSVSGTMTGNAAGLANIPAANLSGNVNNNIAVTATANTTATVGNIVSLVINGVTYQLLAV